MISNISLNSKRRRVDESEPQPIVKRSNSSGTSFSSILIIPAGLTYVAYQLGIQAIKKTYKGIGVFFLEVGSMGVSGLKEGGKFVRILPPTINETTKVPRREVVNSIRELSSLVFSGGKESLKLAVALPSWVWESSKMPMDVTGRTLWEIDSFAESGGYEFIKGVLQTLKSTANVTCVIVPPARWITEELASQVAAGGKEGFKGAIFAADGIPRFFSISSEFPVGMITELCSYIPPGTYEVKKLSLALANVIIELVSRETVKTLILELISYANSGYKETIKASEIVLEPIGETIRLLSDLLVGMLQEGSTYGSTGVKESKKVVITTADSMVNIARLYQKDARDAVKELFSYLYAGGYEGIKGSIAALPAIENGTRFPREVIQILIIEIISHIFSGTCELGKFLKTTKSAIDEGIKIPSEVISTTSEELFSQLNSGLHEGTKLTDTTFREGRIVLQYPKELIEMTLYEVANYLLSGSMEAVKFAKGLRGDLPDAYQALVADPIEIWWLGHREQIIAWSEQFKRDLSDRIAQIQRVFGV